MNSLFRIPSGVALLLAIASPATLHARPALPVEAFAKLPEVNQLRLSPNGKQLAMLVNKENNTSIVVQDLDHPEQAPVPLLNTDNRQYQYRWLHWAGDERLVVSMGFPAKRNLIGAGSVGGIETQETRLVSVPARGGAPVNLFKPHSFKGQYQAQFQDQVIDWEADGGKHILVALSDQERVSDPAVFSVDTESGTRSVVHASRERFRSWMVDRQHRVRLGVRQEGADVEIHVCNENGQEWRKLWSYKVLSEQTVTPLGFDKDPNRLFILANHNGHTALFSVDLRDAQLTRQVVLADANMDISGNLVYSQKTGEVVGLSGMQRRGKADANYWNPEYNELVHLIDDALPQRFNRIASMSKDETRYIVYSSSDKIAGEYYLGDDNNNSMKLYAQTHPDLPTSAMNGKQALHIKARDGLNLPAFLTLPQAGANKMLPTVLLVHGGPQSHDDNGFDAWTQFLSNRGYAVLQVNFRGSTGFGSELKSAGLQRWGLEMQDDLTDATNWMIQRGTADPKRICVVGASYGGYAALMGLAKTPDLYRCGISFAGVSDLVELGFDKANFRNTKEVFAKQIGSVDSERERLKATSPRYLADQIKAPVLLLHGTQDRSVPYVQSEWMDAALTAAGKSHRFIVQANGDHHLSLYQHSLEFFREMEQFLAQHLDGARSGASSQQKNNSEK